MNMNDTIKMQLFEKLRSKGIPFAEKQIKKNGVIKTGLMIGIGIKRPIIYYDHYPDSASVDDMISDIEYVYNYDHSLNCESIDFRNWNAVKDKVYLIMQKEVDSEEASCKVLNLYACLRIRLDDATSVVVTNALINGWGISQREAFATAHANIEDKAYVQNILDVLPPEYLQQLDVYDITMPMFVVGIKDYVYGAGAMILPRVLEHICERIGTGQLIIYPLSVCEILVTPYTDDLAHIATEIVPEINNTMVAAEDQLSDLPYLFDSATQKLALLEEVTEYE